MYSEQQKKEAKNNKQELDLYTMQVPDEVTLSKQVNEYSWFYLNIMVSYYAY